MGKILYGTHYLSSDEPCFGLYEMNLMSPDNSGWRRYQIVYVMRDDRVAEYRQDMGKAKSIKADQFRIPGGVIDNRKIWIEHTVGELRDIANQLRGNRPFDLRELAQLDKIKEF